MTCKHINVVTLRAIVHPSRSQHDRFVLQQTCFDLILFGITQVCVATPRSEHVGPTHTSDSAITL